MRRGGVEGNDAEAQKHSLGLIAVTCLWDANCNTAQQGLSRLKETCLQSVTWMDKQCRVLTSANKKQSRRSCLHTPAPMIDLQASTRRWRAAMHSLDRCYHALLLLWRKGTILAHLHWLRSNSLNSSFDQYQEIWLHRSVPSFGNDLTGQVAKKYVDLSRWQACNATARIWALFLFIPDCLFTQSGERCLRGIRVTVIPLTFLSNGKMKQSAVPEWGDTFSDQFWHASSAVTLCDSMDGLLDSNKFQEKPFHMLYALTTIS